MKNKTHTPTPWTSELGTVLACSHDLHDDYEDCEIICAALHKPDAAYIVRSVNAHEELLDALIAIDNAIADGEVVLPTKIFAQLRQAIAKAEGR